MARGQFLAENVDEQRCAIDKRRRDPFERHFGGRDVKVPGQCATELAEGLGRD